MHQAAQQSAAEADPTAQVILKTQMAETQRKSQEAQSKMQLETTSQQQEYQIKIAELQQKMADLETKYRTQSSIDSQRNATQIAMADINNSSRERIAEISAKAQLSQSQLQMQHEQDTTAFMTSQEASTDLRQHGLEIQQQAFTQQAEQAQQAAQAQQQQADQAHQAQQQQQQQVHEIGQQQMDQAHQQQMQANQPQPVQPIGE